MGLLCSTLRFSCCLLFYSTEINEFHKKKNTLQGINSGVSEAEDQIRGLEDKEAENTQSEWQKQKRIQKMRIV